MLNGKTVLAEVGVGPLSMSFGMLHANRPDMHIMLFEPHPLFCAELIAAAAGRPNVEIHNVAIGDDTGTLKLFDEGTSSAVQGVASPVAQHWKKDETTKRSFDVQVRRISDYDTGQIDLLRLDTEGAEWFCLKHLVSRPHQIVVEIYNDLATYINPHLYEIVEWAEQNGYVRVQVRDSDFVYVRQ